MPGAFFFNVATLVLTIGSVAPQSIRSLRYRTVEGVSATTATILTVAVCSWLAYGIGRHDGLQIITNVLTLIPSAALLAIFYRQAPDARSLIRGQLVIGFAVAGGALFTIGVSGIGIYAVSLSMVCYVPQAWKSIRQPSHFGLSVSAHSIGILASGCWIAYGLSHGDSIVWVNSTICLALRLIIIGRTMQVRRQDADFVAEVDAEEYALAA